MVLTINFGGQDLALAANDLMGPNTLTVNVVKTGLLVEGIHVPIHRGIDGESVSGCDHRMMVDILACVVFVRRIILIKPRERGTFNARCKAMCG